MWFDPISSWFVALISCGVPWLNEKMTKTIPAENWANKELQYKDRMNGVSSKEILRRAEAGRYYIPKEIAQAYPTPHREPNGQRRIIIENDELRKADLCNYDALQVKKWVEQGKYNLNAEELEIVRLQMEKRSQQLYSIGNADSKYANRIKEIDAILATKHWDCRNTEAVKQWQKAHDAESKYYK